VVDSSVRGPLFARNHCHPGPAHGRIPPIVHAPTAPRPNPGKLFFLGAALLALPLLVVLGVVLLIEPGDRWASHPDAVRPWAVEEYERTLSPSTRVALPALADLPLPAVEVVDSEKGIEITGSKTVEFRNEPCHELFFADGNGTVTLPDGTRLTLEAIALLLPSDVRDDDDRTYPKGRPEWVDPRTGQPYVGDSGATWWQKERSLPHDQPRLQIHVKKEGGASLCWHSPRIFDARSRVSLNSVSTYSETETDGDFWVGLHTWHQTSIEISVPFAYGPVEEHVLELREGATVEFGPAARVELLRLVPGRVSSSEWGGGSDSFRSFFHRPSGEASTNPERSAILFVWPPPAAVMIETLTPDGKGDDLLHGNDGVSYLAQSGEKATATEVRLRHYPRLGRAVFRLPKLPRLPEVENLFATPIPKMRIDRESEWLANVADAVEARQIHSGTGTPLPHSLFPMEVENTTPGKLLAEYERQSGKPVYFDDDTFELTGQPPPGLAEKIQEWWRSTGITVLRP
jgi:hypothetical protein